MDKFLNLPIKKGLFALGHIFSGAIDVLGKQSGLNKDSCQRGLPNAWQ